MSVATSWVEIPVEGSIMPSYLAVPEGEGKRGAVVVIQEIFGVNEDIRKLTELVASAGYDALAPAVFHRVDPYFDATHDEAGFAKGRAAASATSRESLSHDLGSAMEWMRRRDDHNGKIATWGFCFGGSVAFFSATLPDVAAAVSFYGAQTVRARDGGPGFITLAPQVHAPLFFAFGGKDENIPAADRAVIRQALDDNRKPYVMRVFEEEDHGFFRAGPEGNAGSRSVWPEVQAFLATHLRG
ncbi:MAG: dienelactone hydrolase family protein [Vulcanimicrobiaceae bacterium]